MSAASSVCRRSCEEPSRASTPENRGGEISNEIDSAVWQVISATVAANDIEGMAAIYHPDAVLVSPEGTVSIAVRTLLSLQGSQSKAKRAPWTIGVEKALCSRVR